MTDKNYLMKFWAISKDRFYEHPVFIEFPTDIPFDSGATDDDCSSSAAATAAASFQTNCDFFPFKCTIFIVRSVMSVSHFFRLLFEMFIFAFHAALFRHCVLFSAWRLLAITLCIAAAVDSTSWLLCLLHFFHIDWKNVWIIKNDMYGVTPPAACCLLPFHDRLTSGMLWKTFLDWTNRHHEKNR